MASEGDSCPTAPISGLQFDRRTVLTGATALTLAVTGSATAMASKPGTALIRYAVFDSRLTSSVSFARTLAARGAEPLDVAGGLTRLWQDSLLAHWRDGSGVVVGLTTRMVWDALSQQAMAQFRRPAPLALHHIESDGGLALHRIGTGIAETVPEGADRNWPEQMAQLAERCAARVRPLSAALPTGRAVRVPGACQHLATWIIR